MSSAEAVAALPEAARRELCLELLAEAGAVAVRVDDRTGEIVHGCLMTPSAHHNQKADPTASLNYRKLLANCFGCKAAGPLGWFTAVVLGTDDAGAAAWLSGRGGGHDGVLPLAALLATINAAFDSKPTADSGPTARPDPLPHFDPSALDAYDHPSPWWTDPPEDGGRGVHPDTVARFRLGHDPATKRAVIPHFWREDLVGWQTRATPASAEGPKYLNTPAFPKRTTIFGHDPGAEEQMWVESCTSHLRHAHAFGDLFATFGSQVHDAQIGRVVASRRLKRVLLWPDPDEAGWKAVDGGRHPEAGLIRRFGAHVPVFVVNSPFSVDLGGLDTALAVRVRERFAVPAALWKRPDVLLCPVCMERSHAGPCPAAQGRG